MSNDRKVLSLRKDTSHLPAISERLHKVLANAGLGSRRSLEERIAAGEVRINGEIAQLGASINNGDRIEIDSRRFAAVPCAPEEVRVLMFHKPEGLVTTTDDPEGRPTVFEKLPRLKGARWVSVGRLDINTTGLLLLTTDGELANAMMHPSYEVEREYVVRVRAPEGQESVPDNVVDRLRRGVALDDGPAKFDEIERIGGTDSHDWFRVVVKEGRNREVRRLWESQGCQVSRLKRVRYGKVSLPQPLLRGQTQELPDAQVEALRKDLGLEVGTPAALTLQPVIGQRKASKSTVHVGGGRSGSAYVNGHNSADEGRELRRFDHVREDRGRGGRGRKPHGGLTVSGEQAAKQSQRPFKQRTPKGPKPLPDGNPAAFRSWYVPDGVDTGPAGHRNAGPGGPKKPYGGKPGGRPGAGGKPGGGGAGKRGPGGGQGGFGGDRFGNERGPGFGAERGPRGGQGAGKPQRAARPYGHPASAPSFPSDHANPGFNPYGQQPRGPRPQGRPGGGGNRPQHAGGPRPGGRPAGGRGPGGRPGGGGQRGPRGGGHG